MTGERREGGSVGGPDAVEPEAERVDEVAHVGVEFGRRNADFGATDEVGPRFGSGYGGARVRHGYVRERLSRSGAGVRSRARKHGCGSVPRPDRKRKPVTPQPITAALFDFLRDLRENNDREWFAANKGRYLADVRDPMLDFIESFAAPLAEISPHFVADRPGERRIAVPDLSGHAFFAGQDSLQDERGRTFPPCRRQGRARPRLLSPSRARDVLCRVRDLAAGWSDRDEDPRSDRRRAGRLDACDDCAGVHRDLRVGGRFAEAAAAGLRPGPSAGRGFRSEAQGFRCGYEFFGGRSAPGGSSWSGSLGSPGAERRSWSSCRTR